MAQVHQVAEATQLVSNAKNSGYGAGASHSRTQRRERKASIVGFRQATVAIAQQYVLF